MRIQNTKRFAPALAAAVALSFGMVGTALGEGTTPKSSTEKGTTYKKSGDDKGWKEKGKIEKEMSGKRETHKQAIDDAKAAIDLFQKADPSLEASLNQAVGFAVFPRVAKGAVGIGGAGGKGVLYEKGVPTGTARMSQVTIGLALGAQDFAELVVFKDEDAIAGFKRGTLEFSAQTSAVAAKKGASATARYERGVQVFTIAKSGLMFEASIGGQRFTYTPFMKEEVSQR